MRREGLSDFALGYGSDSSLTSFFDEKATTETSPSGAPSRARTRTSEPTPTVARWFRLLALPRYETDPKIEGSLTRSP
jgi:hypothetical protein